MNKKTDLYEKNVVSTSMILIVQITRLDESYYLLTNLKDNPCADQLLWHGNYRIDDIDYTLIASLITFFKSRLRT